MEQRTCPVCGKSFKPRTPSAVYCPPEPGKTKSRCAIRAQNFKHRHGRVATAEELALIAPFDCAHCGQHCIPGENVAPHATKFCGYDCKMAWHTEHADGANRRWAEAKARRDAAATRRRRARRKLVRAAQGRGPSKRPWVAGPCAECGTLFVDWQWSAICCSRVCSRRNGQRRSNRRRAERYGWNDSNRARARRYGVAYETIRVRDVFERDSYRCGICGGRTEQDAKVPDPRAPTLDHIVPMSKGGPHLHTNVQCACFRCNSLKGDRGTMTDQLLLVG